MKVKSSRAASRVTTTRVYLGRGDHVWARTESYFIASKVSDHTRVARRYTRHGGTRYTYTATQVTAVACTLTETGSIQKQPPLPVMHPAHQATA